MSKRILIAQFEKEQDLLGALKATRTKGLKILDVFTPYAVHGLDKVLGMRSSRLTWACAIFGLMGASLIAWFQFWVSASDWPINVGGKPWNSLLAFTPVIFECMVLLGGVGVVITFFIVSRLLPGRKVKMITPKALDDRFTFVIEQVDSTEDFDSMKTLYEQFNIVDFKEQVIEGGIE